LESISVDWRAGTALVKTRPGKRELPAALLESLPAAAEKGSIYAAMMSQLDTLRLPDAGEARISGSTLRAVLDTMRQHDTIHRHARSVHSCALFQHDRLLVSVEDVSRHNGLDTVSGWMALHASTAAIKILFTTGRLTGEMVIKAAQSGVPIVVSRNGVSTMATIWRRSSAWHCSAVPSIAASIVTSARSDSTQSDAA